MNHPAKPRRRGRRQTALASLVTLTLGVPLAQAQVPMPVQDAGGRGYTLQTHASLSETITDNHKLRSTDRRADAITEASAGVHLSSAGGRLRGFLDYTLTGAVYARQSSLNELRNALATAWTAEVADNHAFVDVRGSIAQQSISAFGTQSPDDSLANDNRSEVATLFLSPYVVGRLGRFADVEARLTHQETHSAESGSGDSATTAARLHASGLAGPRVGWSADLSRTVFDYRTGRRAEDDRFDATLSWRVDPQLTLSATAGVESTDLASLDKETHDTYGVQAVWTPSVRTTLSASAHRRFFGDAHAVSFTHRTPRTVWTLIDARDVSTSNGQGEFTLGNAYDLFFRQFASTEPDPIKRDLLVRGFLQANGIDPDSNVTTGFLASAVTLQRTQSLSMGLMGVRTTLMVHALRTRSNRLDVVSTAVDDFTQSEHVEQRGVSASVAHRLTPLSAVNLTMAWKRSIGDLASQSTILRSIVLTWATSTGPRSRLLLGVRRADFSSPTAPYEENALFATYRLQF